MKVLGIDPGYERLGIAILEKNQKEKLIFSECFKTSSKDEHSNRLALIQNKIKEIIAMYGPEFLAIETLFFNSNQKTALLVAQARGVILATAKNSGLKIYEYSPQQIKIAVTNNGRSDKNSVIKMIPLLVKIEKEIKHDDEYDAIATGLTFLSSNIKLI